MPSNQSKVTRHLHRISFYVSEAKAHLNFQHFGDILEPLGKQISAHVNKLKAKQN